MELNVSEAAAAVGVTEEAVRARLRHGTLPGRQVRRGRRTVWRIDADAVARWRDRRLAGADDLFSGDTTDPYGGSGTVAAAAARAGEGALPAGGDTDRVVALEAELDRLRRQVAVLTETVVALTRT